eukprot:s2633_g16.t1
MFWSLSTAQSCYPGSHATFHLQGFHCTHGMAPVELFLSLLEDGYPLEGLKKIDLEGFDWNSRHESGQTLLVVRIANAMIQPEERFEDALETLEWLIRSGASTEQKCTGGQWNFCLPHKPETPAVPVQCKGLSAISFVRAVAQKMRANLKDWKREEAFLVKVMARFAAAFSLSAAGPRVSIHEGVAELWEKSLAAKDSHDLTMETTDGLVTAHAHMLKAASSVVTAMLASPMKEGKAQRIKVKDTSRRAVSLFLEILYTCSVQDELDHQTAVQALDLAHRWQVDVVVAILTDLLAGMITDESFSVITEHAILKAGGQRKISKHLPLLSALGPNPRRCRLISRPVASLLLWRSSSTAVQRHRSQTSRSPSAVGCERHYSAEGPTSVSWKSPLRDEVSVHEGIAELWEKSLAAKHSHDLTIETADGLVTAHAHFLKTASSVVTAMLESPMKEGKAQRIEVDVVVAILTDLLAGGLERLKAAILRFGAESKKVQAAEFGGPHAAADLKAGRLPAVVAQLFPAASKPSKSKEPKPKRRRVLFKKSVGLVCDRGIRGADGTHLEKSRANCHCNSSVPQLVSALMAPAELLLALLEHSHPLEDLKKIDLEGFDWSTRFETGQTLLVRCIRNALVLPEERKVHHLKTIDWLIGCGARIEQACTGGQSAFGWPSKPEIQEVKVQCKGLSAIAYVRVLRGLMRENLEHWKVQDDFLIEVLSLFAASSPSASRHRVPIDEGIAELWEKSLAAKDSHDLTIETADGLVTAHAHMLKAASSVVTAMLESPMKEGKAYRIEIQDTPSKAVSLFLEILYTCSVQDELDHQTALHALDLAHRWQVQVVVVILTDLLTGMITDESWAAIAEHAVLKGLERLKAAAQRFGAESEKVQADLGAGRLPAVVAQLFPAASQPSKPNEPKPKRRRV